MYSSINYILYLDQYLLKTYYVTDILGKGEGRGED